jgi:hypothetical protein
VLAFVAIVVGGGILGMALSQGTQAPQQNELAGGLGIFVMLLGGLSLFVGVSVYTLVLVSNCFISDFDRPFMPYIGKRLWTANLLVGLFLQLGGGLMLWPMTARFAAQVLPPPLVIPVSFFGPIVLLQIIFVWFSVVSPLTPALIRRRLTAYGITEEQMAAAMPIGISDPNKSSLKKFTIIEEDLGMLWIGPDRLIYRGDAMGFDIERSQMMEVERKVDAGAVSAYFGAVHVIIRFRDADGAERRIRLHVESTWTMTGTARELDRLAKTIQDWAALGSTHPATASAAPAS